MTVPTLLSFMRADLRPDPQRQGSFGFCRAEDPPRAFNDDCKRCADELRAETASVGARCAVCSRIARESPRKLRLSAKMPSEREGGVQTLQGEPCGSLHTPP